MCIRDSSEPSIYDSQKLDLTLKHHSDGLDLTGPDQAKDDLLGYMGTKMMLKMGPKEYPGQVGETFGRMK
eukprot:13611957-Alexandrium_andersonii.AAC.1